MGAIKIRIHGDYRLDRLLVVKDDVIIVGFGEDAFADRSNAPDIRRCAMWPSCCVLLRNAVAAAKNDLARLIPDASLAAARLREELILFSQIFIQAYMDAARDSPVWIEDEAHEHGLLVLYLLAELLR